MSEPTTWDDLVGRAEQQDVLTAFLARNANGRGAALAVSGPPGVGKSVLIEATIGAATSAGHVVLAGSGSDFETGIGFATLNQVLSPMHDMLPVLDRHDQIVLAGVFGHGPAIGASREQIADATLAAVTRIDPRAPVLIAVDDLHLVDRASAAVFARLARAATGRSLGVLVAHRSNEQIDLDMSAFERIEIPPLGPQAASTFLSAHDPHLAPSVRERVLGEAQGNPLALIELATALSDRQRRGADVLPTRLPLTRRLRRIFADPILRLDAPVRQLLLLAALDGGGTLTVLAAALRQDVTTLASGEQLSAAADSGLITVERDGAHPSRVVFRHPLIRATVVEISRLDDRRRAHRALAGVYADRPERRAHHDAEATSRPDAAVADRLEEIARSKRRRGDAVGAVDLLLRAAELSPSGPDRRRRMVRAAHLCTDATGDLTRASALLADARATYPAANTLDETVATVRLLLVGAGDADTAFRLLVAALCPPTTTTTQAGSRSLIAAFASLVEVCLYTGRAECWAPVRTAAALLHDIVPVELRALIAVLADPARATRSALAQLDAALASFEADQDQDPRAVERLAAGALFVDRVVGCEAALRKVADASRSSGAITGAVRADLVLWAEEFRRGRWDSCAARIDDALTLCLRNGLTLYTTLLRYGQALLAAARGDDAANERLGVQIGAWAAPRGLRAIQHLGWHARALSAIGRGDFAEAHRLFELIAPPGAVPDNAPHTLWMIYDVVEAAIRSGHRSEAVAYLDTLRRIGIRDVSARLAMVFAGASALAAPAAQAGPLFEAALTTPGAGDWPFDHARIRLAYGEHLRRQRKITLARAELRLALRELRSLSAWPWVTRAAAELRAAQTSSQSRDRVLTPQQQEIAALAGTGMTNKQIAQRLQLSPRTVAAHLREVFPKLGIASRGALHDAMRDTRLASIPALKS